MNPRVIILCASFLGVNYIANADNEPNDSTKHRNGLMRTIDTVVKYFERANQPHPEKVFDISFIGGPEYSNESGFGIGLVGSGLYYTHRDENKMPSVDTPVSNVSLILQVTTGQLYKVGAEGRHIFKGNICQIDYDGYFYSFKDKFWGIGYDKGVNNDNESSYRRLQAQIKAEFVFKLANGLYLGPYTKFNYINATQVDNVLLFDREDLRTFTTGLGMTFLYDTRDVPFNAYKGVCIRLNQLFNPRFLANRYAFSETEFTSAVYFSAWKNCIIAGLFHTTLTYGNTPWGLLSTFGDSQRMRGYYEGRYRDKCEADITVELRQHIWRRNGLVFWIGAGTVFPRLSDFNVHHILPNIGIGYRWQFKPRVNVRLDFGIGKNTTGINFSINEAF